MAVIGRTFLMVGIVQDLQSKIGSYSKNPSIHCFVPCRPWLGMVNLLPSNAPAGNDEVFRALHNLDLHEAVALIAI